MRDRMNQYKGFGVLFLVLIAGPRVHAAGPDIYQEVPGALIIGGGGALPDAVGDRFVELAGGAEARVVVLSAADAPGAPGSLDLWKKKGVARLSRQRPLVVISFESHEDLMLPSHY